MPILENYSKPSLSSLNLSIVIEFKNFKDGKDQSPLNREEELLSI